MSEKEKKEKKEQSEEEIIQSDSEVQTNQISDLLDGVNPPAGGGDSEMTPEEEEEELKKEFGFDEEDEDEEEEEGLEEEEEEDPDPDEDEEEEEDDPDEEEEEDEEEDSTVEALRKRVEKLSGELDEARSGKPVEKKPVEKEEEEEKAKKPKTPTIDDIQDFISDDDVEEIMENPKKLNKVLKQVYLKAQEDIMANIPNLVRKSTQRTVTVNNAVQGFYKNNPDLTSYKKVVGYTANEVESENPDWDISKVLTETEKRVRESLNIEKKAKSTEKKRKKEGKKKPAAPHKPKGKRGGGSPKGKAREGQKGQIDDLID